MPAELFASLAPTPLPERLRPKSLDEIRIQLAQARIQLLAGQRAEAANSAQAAITGLEQTPLRRYFPGLESDARRMRQTRPFIFTNLKSGEGAEAIADFIVAAGGLEPRE